MHIFISITLHNTIKKKKWFYSQWLLKMLFTPRIIMNTKRYGQSIACERNLYCK